MPMPGTANEASGWDRSDVVSFAHYEVTDEAVHAYLEATIGARRWSELTRGRSPVPPLFGAIVAREAVWEAVAAYLRERTGVLGVVQFDHEMRVASALRGGDRVVSSAVVDSGREGPLGSLATVRVQTRRPSGESVCSMAAGLLVIANGDLARQAARKAGSAEGPARARASVRDRPGLRTSFRVEPAHVERYAAVSGDRNPIHVDDRAARAVGLPSVVAHGLCVLATAVHAGVDRYAGGHPEHICHVRARFVSPVFPGDTVTTTYESLGPSTLRFRATTARAVVLKSGRIRLDRR